MKVLVTGATGTLGKPLVSVLRAKGMTVRPMSRRPSDDPDAVQADLAQDSGIREAVDGVDAIVHAASATTRPWQYSSVDVRGTQRLLVASRDAGVQHFLYPSIVGMEGVPHPYFKPKLAAEALLSASGGDWTILRATQFYSLVDQMIRVFARLPLVTLPKRWRLQPIDPADVAQQIALAIAQGPSGRLPDVGGPEVRTLGDLAQAWLAQRGSRRTVHNLPMPGRLSRAFAQGQLTCPDRALGRARWEEWLASHAVNAQAKSG